MTGPVPTEALVEAPYVLLKRGLFYGPNNQGYTGVLRKAGRYTREDAEARADHCAPAVTMMLASEAPDYSPACWHEVQIADLLDLLRIEREAKATALAAHQQVTAERDEARATDRESVRRRLIEAHEQLCEIDADGELPVRARDKNPPDTLRAVAERAVQMLEEIRAEDAAKGRPWWGHTLAKFALDDLVYALAELPDPEASLATANAELARLRAEGEEARSHLPEGLREVTLVAAVRSLALAASAENESKWRWGHALQIGLAFADKAAGEEWEHDGMASVDACYAMAAILDCECGGAAWNEMVKAGAARFAEHVEAARAATAREG